MKKNLLAFDISRLKKEFNCKFPELERFAKGNTVESFKKALSSYLNVYYKDEELTSEKRKALNNIHQLIRYDGKIVNELSTGEQLPIQTITLLWKLLNDEWEETVSVDLFIDLYKQFSSFYSPQPRILDRSLVKRQMNRWPTGLDEEVVAIRARSKERIIHKLIHKIERRHSVHSKYYFSDELNYEEKYQKVLEWWNTSRFHLSSAIKSPSELNYFLDKTLSTETIQLLINAKRKGMPFFVTPYYLSLLNIEEGGFDDSTIRSYILYSKELVDTYGNIRAWEKEDLVEAGKPNAAGWLLPEGHNIHRRYPEVAILIPDSMGRACGGLCASCQRMYDFQSERLNFDFNALKPKETWDKKLRRLMNYFEEDTQLRDVLITGGDALMSQNATLRKILDAVYKMAIRKKIANKNRPQGEKYAEIQRIRLGTRLPAYLPMRITEELVEILRNFRDKASKIDITQFYIQTHFQSPLEVTPEARRAIRLILDAGWTIMNQLVFTVSASRKGHTAKLRQILNSEGVVCYYTFSVKGFYENYGVFTPNARSLQEKYEEKSFGIIPQDKLEELDHIIRFRRPIGKHLHRFLKENHLLFAATDRNVLNLPGIGKSMTFQTVGITEGGKRILRFEHDGSRLHSPIIGEMGEVYIVENKSIAAYLRQLQEQGEDINEYRSLWTYCEGKTESRFSLYNYPDYSYRKIEKMTNLKL